MFAIATPQTVELLATKPVDPSAAVDPNKPVDPPESHGTATFSHPTDDVSECQLVIASKDRSWTFRFNTQGTVISTAYEDDETRAAAEQARKDAEEAEKQRAADAAEPKDHYEPAE